MWLILLLNSRSPRGHNDVCTFFRYDLALQISTIDSNMVCRMTGWSSVVKGCDRLLSSLIVSFGSLANILSKNPISVWDVQTILWPSLLTSSAGI